MLLLEAPAAGRRAIADDIGRDLKRGEREWLEAERFARMLARSRATDKKYQEGQIRWYLRQDPDDAVVLDRYGAVGHWLVVGDGDPGALARAGVLAARATDEQRKQSADAWRDTRRRRVEPGGERRRRRADRGGPPAAARRAWSWRPLPRTDGC